MQLPPNDVPFESSVVRHFHGLRWLLETTFPSQAFYFRDVLFVVFTLLSSPLSVVSMMTCDLQVNQSQLRYSTRQVCIRGSKEENLIHSFPLKWKKSICNNIFRLHCIHHVCICFSVDISEQFSQISFLFCFFFKKCYDDLEKKVSQMTKFG